MNTTQTTEQQDLIIARANRRIEDNSTQLKAQHDKLAAKPAAGTDHVSIAQTLEAIAEKEGQRKAFQLISKHIPMVALDSLIAERLLDGPDDGWSGRTNDARRAFFDGLRSAFRDARNWVA